VFCLVRFSLTALIAGVLLSFYLLMRLVTVNINTIHVMVVPKITLCGMQQLKIENSISDLQNNKQNNRR
jgi:hypothetical protein